VTNSIPAEVVIGLIALLAVMVAAALVWAAVLQNRLNRSRRKVAKAIRDVDALRDQAHHVAFAKVLMETEHAVGASVQSSVAELTARFSEQLERPISQIAKHTEGAVDRVLKQHVERLKAITAMADSQMEKGVTDLLSKFDETLTRVSAAAAAPLEEIGSSAARERAALTERMHSDVERERNELVTRFDTRLADLVSNYLMETLGNDVDLGAQGPYLFRMLEEHRAELREELVGGA
jgi:DNA anti-recombination protein RmuC